MAEIVKANIANALNSLSGVLGTSDQIVDNETGKSIKDDIHDLDRVFVAEYGVTTWNEVQSALNAGKMVVVNRNNLFYYPIAISSTQVRFSAVQSPATIRMVDCKTTGWLEYGNTPLQNTSNLVTSLSVSSTNTQYPSAKCVYDLIGNVESLLAAI